MNTVSIDLDSCSGCKTCYKACFVDVIRWDAVEDKPIVAYPEDCVECLICEINCPVECIEVIVDWDKPWPPLLEPAQLDQRKE